MGERVREAERERERVREGGRERERAENRKREKVRTYINKGNTHKEKEH